MIENDTDATLSYLALEPVALFGLTLTEVKYILTGSLGVSIITLALLVTPVWGVNGLFFGVLLGFVLGMLMAWRIGKRIRKLKVGKPHHFYIHHLQRKWLANTPFKRWPTHVGRYRLGRTTRV